MDALIICKHNKCHYRSTDAIVIGGGVMSYNQEYIERGYVFLWKWELFRLGRRYVPL